MPAGLSSSPFPQLAWLASFESLLYPLTSRFTARWPSCKSVQLLLALLPWPSTPPTPTSPTPYPPPPPPSPTRNSSQVQIPLRLLHEKVLKSMTPKPDLSRKHRLQPASCQESSFCSRLVPKGWEPGSAGRVVARHGPHPTPPHPLTSRTAADKPGVAMQP